MSAGKQTLTDWVNAGKPAADPPTDIISELLRSPEGQPNPDANPDLVDLPDFMRFGDVLLVKRPDDSWVASATFDWSQGFRSSALTSFKCATKSEALRQLRDAVFAHRCAMEVSVERFVEIENEIGAQVAALIKAENIKYGFENPLDELTAEAQANGEYDVPGDPPPDLPPAA